MDALSDSSFISVPEHFGIVVDTVYRSETLQPVHLAFLQTLGLRTILHLTPERPSKAVMTFVEENKINWVHLGARLAATRPSSTASSHKDGPVHGDLVKGALELVLDRAMNPILIMDQSGIHETGVVVGCLRKMMHWNFTSIVIEYRSFAAALSRYHELELIELFDTTSVSRPAAEAEAHWWAALEREWEADVKSLEAQRGLEAR